MSERVQNVLEINLVFDTLTPERPGSQAGRLGCSIFMIFSLKKIRKTPIFVIFYEKVGYFYDFQMISDDFGYFYDF